MKKFILLFLLMISWEIFGIHFFDEKAYAQVSPSPIFSQSRDIQTTQITGEVLRREGNVLTVKTESGTKEITIPAGIKIKRNTLDAKITDIQPNDKVIITQTTGGTVLTIDVAAGNVFDFAKWGIPLLIIGIIAIFIIWRLFKSANKSHIKTATE